VPPYPQMSGFESGHADRHLPSQASYNATPRHQVHESYAHLANHPSPITAGEADSLADDFHNRLRLPSDGSLRKERQSHHPDALGRGYENQVDRSLGRSKDKKKPTVDRHDQVCFRATFLDLLLINVISEAKVWENITTWESPTTENALTRVS
jgi:hypothetical protein